MARSSKVFLLISFLLPITGCDLLDDVLGTEDAEIVLSVEALTGKFLHFDQASTDGGVQQSEFQYGFISPGVLIACNDDQEFRATDWFVIGENTIHVEFGSQWSEYTFTKREGSIAGNTFLAKYTSATSFNTTNSGNVWMPTAFYLAACPP